MSVFRKAQTTPWRHEESLSGTLIASLTHRGTTLSYKADGIKVEGALADGHAIVEIELNNNDDCFADYTCKVHYFDINAEAYYGVSTYALVHVPEKRRHNR
ncbi:hypothetical protein PoB_007272600 [Plakobranchus ocellatus]|uniref:Uncharacterized protein n=1 Tax=Plakobranchus ocellatus TaxID=259542 RepID=A0AAV4DQ23_9GAST|nr:hypothetical protein PoB_007272600 [Plakobranchus ocellatus]